jgi:hypothetical protein
MGPQGLAGPAGPAGPQGPAGATGAQGPKGDIGPQGPQGLKGLTWLGNWSSSTHYAPDDAVAFNGSSYVAVTPTFGFDPLFGGWDLLAAKGDQGIQGPAGPKGDTGAVGPAGPAGAMGPAGPKGDTGAVGPAGPAGAMGPVGPQGPTGPQGTPGTSGFVGILDTSADKLPVTAGVTTYLCPTPSVTAGANQAAIIITRAGCQLGGNSTFAVRAGYRVTTDKAIGAKISYQNPAHGAVAANVGTGTLALTPGATYVFTTAVDASSPLPYTCACQTIVQIVGQ